jgi:hypothetical protein
MSLIRSPPAETHFETTSINNSSNELQSISRSSAQLSSNVIEVLSAPVSVSDRQDTGADEIAEIVSSHIRSNRHSDSTSVAASGRQAADGDGGDVVQHFKAVSIPPSGN